MGGTEELCFEGRGGNSWSGKENSAQPMEEEFDSALSKLKKGKAGGKTGILLLGRFLQELSKKGSRP